MQPPSRGRRQEEKQADSGRHRGRGQPVAALHRDLPGADNGQVAKDEQKLECQNGLDQGQLPIVQGT